MFRLQFCAQLAVVRASQLASRAWASEHFDTAISCLLGLVVLALVVLSASVA